MKIFEFVNENGNRIYGINVYGICITYTTRTERDKAFLSFQN